MQEIKNNDTKNKTENKINVCFICDEKYVLPTLVAVQSLVKNAQSPVNVHIVGTELSQVSIDQFNKLSSSIAEVTVRNVDNKYQDIPMTHGWVSKAAMLKFDLANLFADLDKILYLDGDMVINQNLGELFNVDVKDCYAAVVADMRGMKMEIFIKDKVTGERIASTNHGKLGLSKYFNSGMMLLNLQKMREDNIPDKLLENKRKDPYKRFMDQDALNQTFAENVMWLSPKYNLMQANLGYPLEEISEFYGVPSAEMAEIMQNPEVLHLTNKLKPWNTAEAVGFDVWWKYFTMLPESAIKTQERKKILMDKIRLFTKKIFGYKVLPGEKHTQNIYLFGIKLFRQKIKSNADIYIKGKCGLRTINKVMVDDLISKMSEKGINNIKRNPRLIVSLTSFPARMAEIHYTIYSLLNQKVKPDEVVLWLGKDKFPNLEADLPAKLLKFQDYGLTIKWCKDIRSFTKLLPSLKEYPEDIIVTADDDVYYPETWLEKLYQAYYAEPDIIHCHRAHLVLLSDEGEIISYNDWWKSCFGVPASYYNFLTGVGGVLYPPKCLGEEVFDEKYKELTPLADDIWFWAIAVRRGIKINVIPNPIRRLTYINADIELGAEGTVSLSHQNVHQNRNDTQMEAVLKTYPEIYNRLREDEAAYTEALSAYKLKLARTKVVVKKKKDVEKHLFYKVIKLEGKKEVKLLNFMTVYIRKEDDEFHYQQKYYFLLIPFLVIKRCGSEKNIKVFGIPFSCRLKSE